MLSDPCPCFAADAVDHGDEAVGALGSEVFAEAHFVEESDGVGFGDFGGRAVGLEGEEDGDEALDDQGVAFALEVERGFAVGLDGLGDEPDL